MVQKQSLNANYMKWLFCLFCKSLLRIIGIFSLIISISCTRNAPRYEPEFLGCDHVVPKDERNFKTDSNSIQRLLRDSSGDLHLTAWLSYCHRLKDKDDLGYLLKDIGYAKLLEQLGSASLTYSKELKKEVLFLTIVPNPDLQEKNNLSKLVEAMQAASKNRGKKQITIPIRHTLPNKLSILFDRHKGVSQFQPALVGIEKLTINANTQLPNSEKYAFALSAFLLDISNVLNNGPKRCQGSSIAFVKLGTQWYYYNNGKKNSFDNKKAIDLASKYGTLFFYQKIAG